MPDPHTATVDLSLAQKLLLKILSESLDSEVFSWAQTKFDTLSSHWSSQSFHLTFGMASRKIPRDLPDNPTQYAEEAEAILSGWAPQQSSLDCLYRVLLISAYGPDSEEEAEKFLWDVFDTADMWEQVAVFSALPILPYPKAYVKLAAEGLRTNMSPVFDAVALNNPYPALYFSEAAWNQMYLKAAFVGRPIHKILSIAERANENLSRIILDYVEERWSAGREVNPEFWHASTQFLSEDHIEALKKLSQNEKEVHRAVVALIRKENAVPELMELALKLTKSWTWELLGETYNMQTAT